MTDRFMSTATRRDLVIGGVALGVSGAMPAAQAQQTLRLRPDIQTMSGAKMIALYATAVRAMQKTEINYPPQPQSWQFQAYIHSVPVNPFDPANSGGLRNGTPGMKTRIDEIYGNPAAGSPQALWKEAALRCWGTCTHGSPYFTIWHRWYMYYFERICRSMCNDASFMLPYWNYGSALGLTLQLPQPFRDQNTPLLFDDRGLGFANPQGSGPQNVAMNLGGYMPFPLINYGPALGAMAMFPSDDTFAQPPDPAYYAFGLSGRLECVPHDMVHVSVGGWMGNVPSAAGDPVFFVHHCQVDRLYASWEAVPGVTYNWGNGPTQPSESTWKDRPAFFVDEKGELVQVKLGDAIDTVKLGYGYDTLAKPPTAQLVALTESRIERAAAAAPIVMAALKAKGFSVGTGGATVTLDPADAATVRPEAPERAAPSPRADGAAPTMLVFAGLKLLRRPPAPLSVFINLPKGTEPQLNGPFYVGTLNFFNFDLATGLPMRHGDDHEDHSAAPPVSEARFDVGSLLADQRAKGLWDGGAITVTVATLGAEGPGELTYVSFQSATLTP